MSNSTRAPCAAIRHNCTFWHIFVRIFQSPPKSQGFKTAQRLHFSPSNAGQKHEQLNFYPPTPQNDHKQQIDNQIRHVDKTELQGKWEAMQSHLFVQSTDDSG